MLGDSININRFVDMNREARDEDLSHDILARQCVHIGHPPVVKLSIEALKTKEDQSPNDGYPPVKCGGINPIFSAGVFNRNRRHASPHGYLLK